MELEYRVRSDRIYCLDGERNIIAEVLFPLMPGKGGVASLCNVFVDESLDEKEVSDVLLGKAAAILRMRYTFMLPDCPAAKEWFKNHPEYSEWVVTKKHMGFPR